MVASAFGLRHEGADKAAVFRNLEAFLLGTSRKGIRAILIVDEAQGLPLSALEELRMLSNVYRNGRPLLQVFLIGQPEFRRKLASQGLEQLRQRIVAIHHLTPLSEEETREYIFARLNTAGWNHDPEFTEECFVPIYRETRGVPRLVNNLCDRLLWHAYIEERHEIVREDVELVVEDMRLDAAGLGTESTTPEVELAPESESEEEGSHRGQDSDDADRVVGFRTPYEKER
jgi:type II secretory pathway predicted ATPase ExeA